MARYEAYRQHVLYFATLTLQGLPVTDCLLLHVSSTVIRVEANQVIHRAWAKLHGDEQRGVASILDKTNPATSFSACSPVCGAPAPGIMAYKHC
jgi:hypothetical protein